MADGLKFCRKTHLTYVGIVDVLKSKMNIEYLLTNSFQYFLFLPIQNLWYPIQKISQNCMPLKRIQWYTQETCLPEASEHKTFKRLYLLVL